MTMILGRTRKLAQLRRGDVINIRIPFEENTRDYYNGYKPEEIRDAPFTDRFGKSAKTRMVIYIGRDEETLLYLPLTSKTGHAHDVLHQYQLKDNSMLPSRDPARKSFVEVDSLRAIKVSKYWDLNYTARIGNEDLNNILHRVSNNTMQFDTKRDQRGYIPTFMRETFERELYQGGYQLALEDDYQRTYRKPSTGQVVSRTRYGMVHYHYPLSKEEVREMVAQREGRSLHVVTNEAKTGMGNGSPNGSDAIIKFDTNVKSLSRQTNGEMRAGAL